MIGRHFPRCVSHRVRAGNAAEGGSPPGVLPPQSRSRLQVQLSQMGHAMRVRLARGVLRGPTGARPGITVVRAPPSWNYRGARDVSGRAASSGSNLQSPSPRSTKPAHALLRLSLALYPSRPRLIDSGGILAFDAQASRKRLPGWRSLSTVGSDGASCDPGMVDEARGGAQAQGDVSCWRCDSTVSWRDYFCACGAAQELDGRLDYFEMFGCPPSVFLNLKDVEKQFKNMQRAFHPVSGCAVLHLLLICFIGFDKFSVLLKTRMVAQCMRR